MGQLVDEALLIYVESNANSNKFYRLRRYDDERVHKMWGRVPKGTSGELSGQQKWEQGGERVFQRTLNEKLRKGYTRADIVSVSAPESAELRATAEASLAGGSDDPVVQGLIDRLIAANKHNLMSASGGMITVDTTGQARTALGVISSGAVREARGVLQSLVSATGTQREALTEQYLRIVPQGVPVNAGRGWAQTWIEQMTSAQQQSDLLDALEASASFAETSLKQEVASDVDADFFRYRVTRLDENSDEFREIVDRFNRTKKDQHQSASYVPKYIYTLEDRRHGDEVASAAERVRNVRTLWHGTGAANVLSILQKGLFTPKRGSGINITGRMFGDGIYLSESSTKSLNYSTGYWSRTSAAPSTFMFLTKTAMGYEYRPTSSFSTRPRADKNGKPYDSTNVRPGTAGVVNHEAIIEDPMQVGLRWLVEF